MLRHDRTHPLARALELLRRDEPQVPVRDRTGRHDVEFARGRAADRHGVVGDVGAADDGRCVEGQVLLPHELRAERVEDAGHLVNRAVPRPLAEHARRMCLAAGRRDAPRAGAAARHRGVGAVAGLERQRDVAPLRRLEQRAPRLGERLAGMLLVAGEDDRDIQVAQRARRLQRLERVEDHHIAALHVRGADAAGHGVLAHPVRARRLDHRVEVADEQQPHRPGPPLVLRDEMAGAAHRVRHRRPGGRKPQGVERGAEHCSDFAYTVEVQGAAGNVDDALEIGDLLLARGGDDVAHAPLRAVERLRDEGRGKGEEREENGQRVTADHGSLFEEKDSDSEDDCGSADLQTVR